MKYRLLFLFVLLASFFGPTLTAEEILLTDTEGSYELNHAVSFLIDADRTLSAQEAYNLRNSFAEFPQESVQIPREGVMWLHFRVRNNSSHPNWIVENAMKVELMELFRYSDGRWRQQDRTGNMVPFSDRRLQTRNPAFELQVQENETAEVLIRLYDYQSASVQLELIELEAFRANYQRETFLLGLAFGFFAALIIYNSIIFLFNRDRAYLFYSLYMAAFFMNQLAQERLLSQYLTPNQPYGFFWFVLFGSLTAAFGLEFFRRFIETGQSMPRLDRGMRALRWVMAALAVSAFVYAGPVSADLLNVGSLAAMGLILWALVKRILRRDILALVCLLGSLLYLIGTAAEIVVTLVPAPVTPFALNAQLYGALAQVLFLGFALGAKTFRLRNQYEQIQQQYRKNLEQSVAERTRELEEANRKLEEHAVTDALTGLYNRKELKRRMKEIDPYLARKGGGSSDYVVSVAYLDLDNFKYYNDTYGHGYGDEMLKETAEKLRTNTRPYDLLFRLGGDEFLIIMPEADLDTAGHIVERIRGCFSAASSSTAQEEPLITVSIGLTSSGYQPGVKLEELIQSADAALLKAKAQGKNQIAFH